MIVDPSALLQDIQRGEDSALELKQVKVTDTKVITPHRDSLADELAAFGNADGGRLVLGVTDGREPQSLTPSQLDLLIRFVREICHDSIKPPLSFKVFRVSVFNATKGLILLIEIPKSVHVHESPGGFMVRSGDTKRRLDSNEVRRLSYLRGQSDLGNFDTQIVNGTGVETLEAEIWQSYVSSRIDLSRDEFLSRLKFVKEDEEGTLRATVSGVLMATKSPIQWLPNAWIQAVSYRGNKRDGKNQIDVLESTGPLDRQIRDTVRFAVKNRRVAAYKDPARVDVPQFSARAIFEVIVNAVVHRDYSISGSHIRIFMFDDRLEVYSPGNLCNSMSPEDLRISQFTRNESLATRLGQCEVGDVPGVGDRRYFIERRGEGIAVIEDETYALTGQLPTFEVLAQREFRVTLPSASLPIADGLGVSITLINGKTKKPIHDAHVLMLFPNKTWRDAQTDMYGRAEFIVHAQLPMTVFCAMEGFTANVVHGYDPAEPLMVELDPVENGGSMIFSERSGSLPHIRGRLNPILDNLDRTYLYASNVAVNDGKTQPVQFVLNEPVRLTDAYGKRATLWFREFIGSSCVFDYTYE